MRIRELVEEPGLGLTAVAGLPGLDRDFATATVTDLPDPSRYLRGGELVISGLVWLGDQRRSRAEHCETFVGAVARAGCAGLAAGDTTDAPLPAELLDSCSRHGLPLLHVPAALAFADLTDWITRRTSARRVEDAGELLARHRRLLENDPRAGLAGIVRLIGYETGMPCLILSAAGQVVAGSLRGTATGMLTGLATGAVDTRGVEARQGDFKVAEITAIVSREALRTAAQPERLVTHRGVTYSAYSVPGRPGTAITDWYAVFEGDWRTWSRERREAARGAARLVGAERARSAEAQRAVRRVGRELVELAASGGPVEQIAARLTLAELDPAAGLRAIAVATAGTMRPGRLARTLVDTPGTAAPAPIAVFPHPPAAGRNRPASGDGPPGRPPSAQEAAQAQEQVSWSETEHAYTYAIAIVPAPAAGAHQAANSVPSASAALAGVAAPAQAEPAAVLRSLLSSLAPGLGADRVAVGLSDRAVGPAALAGAVEEAKLAMRLAMRRPGRLEIAGHDELSSHLVLLAHVPDELRRGYRDRLLGPLRDYDARHHSRLESTLECFLACSASWSRSAKELHVHVNTLRYRIDKINQLTGRDLARLDHQVDFYLALRSR